MSRKIIFVFYLLILAGVVNAATLLQKFERSAFYKAMATGSASDIDSQLAAVNSAPPGDRDVYEGVLLMRKAGFAGKPKEKLKYFKSGRIKFQTGFMADSNNAEFRFLRLGIQEHAPKVVKYRSDINADKVFVKEHFKSLPPVVQHAVIEYSKTSKILRPEDF